MAHAKMPPWTNAQSTEGAARRDEWAMRFRRRYSSLGSAKIDFDGSMKRAYALYDAADGLGACNPEAAAWEVLRREVQAEEAGRSGSAARDQASV